MMSQQPLVNTKTLVEMAQKLKTPTADNLTASEKERVRGWRDAVLRRMREIQELVHELHPAFSMETFQEATAEELDRIFPNRLAAHDPRRKELSAEYEELQKKYRRCSNILSGVEKLEDVSVGEADGAK